MLRQSEQRYHMLFNNGMFPALVSNLDGRILLTNKFTAGFFGVNIDEIDQLSTHDFWVSNDARIEYKNELIENGFISHKEIEIKTYNNQIKTLLISSNIINFNNNKAILSILNDITERKMLERQILSSVIETEERERLFFSQELHDGIGPLLSAAKMYVQWLGMPDAKVNQAKIINNIEKLLDESLSTVREISFRLNPHILQNYGLIDAIKAYAEKIMESSGLIIQFDYKDMCQMDEKIETVTYRVICECTNNTIKHAEATNINIKMNCQNGVLFAEYSDNGKGFDINNINQKGIGLLNMQSRIKSLNGIIEISSRPSEGTFIKFQLRIRDN